MYDSRESVKRLAAVIVATIIFVVIEHQLVPIVPGQLVPCQKYLVSLQIIEHYYTSFYANFFKKYLAIVVSVINQFVNLL